MKKKVILLTEGTSTYARDLLRGIAEYSRLNGPWAFYRATLAPFYRSREQPKNLNHLKAWNADGIIVRSTGPEMTKNALALGLPTIACDDNNQAPDVPNVVSDYKMVGVMAARHFLSRGFKNFAYCGFDTMLWSRERSRYFCETIREAGHKVHTYSYPKTPKKRMWENEIPILTAWIQSLPKPVAIMACNDDRASHIALCCNFQGLHVPEEVSVLGVDNDLLLCDITTPPLSSVALNARKAGYETASLLDRMMLGEIPQNHTIYIRPAHVVARQSTDTLAIEDKDVVQAIRFIRRNAREPIQTTDVADAVALSGRALYEKFMKYLGRTVYDEIKRVRIEQISEMLLQTDLPVYQIAQLFRFSSTEHIARYFKTATKMSPLAYRKRFGIVSTNSIANLPKNA